MPGRNSLREERGLFWLTVTVYHSEGGEGERVCLSAGAATPAHLVQPRRQDRRVYRQMTYFY